MQTRRRVWLCLLVLLAVALPAGVVARGGKKRVRNKRRQTAATQRDLADVPPPQLLHKDPQLQYRPQFLSVAECQQLLRLTDNTGSQWNQGAIPGAPTLVLRCFGVIHPVSHC